MAFADQASFAHALADALSESVPGSQVSLTGSLSSGHADRYSDIDLTWVVPDGLVPHCASRVAEVVGTVAEVA